MGIYARRNKGLQAFAPSIFAGIPAIYGLIVSIILVGNMGKQPTDVDGYRYFSAGLSVGLSCLASGLGMARFLRHLNKTAIGNDDTLKLEPNKTAIGSDDIKKKSFVKLCMSLCFLEAIGFYGLIVALFLIG